MNSLQDILNMRSLILLVSVVSLAQAATVSQPTMSSLSCLSRSGHPTLVSLLQLANLTSLFDGSQSDTYTIFAPNERYLNSDLRSLGLTMAQLKNDTALLTSILSYHVVAGSHPKNTFFNDRVFRTLNGAVVRTNHYIHTNQYYVDGSVISNTAYECQQGMVYSVRHLLNPIKGNIYNTIAQDKDLSTLKQAIDAAGLDAFLGDQNPITVFAPTNNAFALLGSKLTSLLANPQLLTEILQYHVVYGSLYAGGMHDETLHTFEEADKITLDVNRIGAKADDARFVTYDISATNGVIHKIGSVLVPDSLKAQL